MSKGEVGAELSIEVGEVKIRIQGSESLISDFLDKSKEMVSDLLRLLEQKDSRVKAPSRKGVAQAAGADKGQVTADWFQSIAEASECTPEFIRDAFVLRDNSLVLVDWDTGEKGIDKKREVALVVLYANDKGLHRSEVPVAAVGVSLEKLRISYDSKSIARELRGAEGIHSEKTGFWSLNSQGRIRAAELLKNREKFLGSLASQSVSR